MDNTYRETKSEYIHNGIFVPAEVKNLSYGNTKPLGKRPSIYLNFASEEEMELINKKIRFFIEFSGKKKILKKLVGPVYKDITLSHDNIDPYTLEDFWTTNSKGERIPGKMDKFLLFSYYDSKNYIRCFSIFTMIEFYKKNKYIHPLTFEPFPPDVIENAKAFVNFFMRELNIEKIFSPKNRMIYVLH